MDCPRPDQPIAIEPTSSSCPKQHTCDALESEITALWGHITAATHRFLELVAEFDRAEGWGRQGLPSCAQWLNLNCGIGMVAAREKVRVAVALEELPKINEAFSSGQISYSKVRAITRVATPEMQDTLLNIALHGTASHVERVVRDFRKAERNEESLHAENRHRERYLRFAYDEDESLLIHAKLPPEVGAIVKQAIEAAMAHLEGTRVDGTSVDTTNVDETEVDGSSAGISSEPARRDNSRQHDSAESSGWPETFELAESSESSEYAELDDPIGARRSDALRLLAERFLNHEAERSPSSTDRYQVVVHIDQHLLSIGSSSRSDLNGNDSRGGDSCDDGSRSDGEHSADELRGKHGRSEIEHGSALAVETARRLACDSALVRIVEDLNGEPLNVGRKTRAISPAMKRALNARDGGCRFPGCDHMRFTEGHHVKHWADGGETKLSNLITLCRFHHRLLHEGGFGLAATDDGLFVFSRPDGQRLHEHQSIERRFRGNILPVLNAERGITPRLATGWHGERMASWWAVESMQWERRMGMG